MSFRIHFHDVPHSDKIRASCETTAEEIRAEFPITSKVEVTISHTGDQHETHVHVTGKDIDMASHAKSREMLESVVDAFDRVRKQLRKHHDKVVLNKRREGHKQSHS